MNLTDTGNAIAAGSYSSIIRILRDRGFSTVPEQFYTRIGVWKDWYDGNVRSFHNFQVFNGQNRVECRRYTMGMAKKVSEDWANLLLNEKVKITLEGQKEQEFFDAVCRQNGFSVKANEMQEMKSALGTVAYVVRAAGMDTDTRTGAIINGTAIKLDYVTAPNIFPLSWENGTVTECAFTSSVTRAGQKYTYLQIHRLLGGRYIIENSIYTDTNGSLSETAFDRVPGMESVAPAVSTGSDKPLFAIDRLNIANNYDNTLPMGIPAFANAIDQLKGVDIAYDTYVNEFVMGKRRVMVKPGAMKHLDGSPVFDPNELYYYVLPEDTSEAGIIVPIDMTLRTPELNAGLQDMLNALSMRCGFGKNYYRFESGSIATATEIISSNQDLQGNVHKNGIILKAAMESLCRIILRLGNSAMGAGLNEDVEVKVELDDSIFIDRDKELADMRSDVAAGLLKGELYIAEKYGVTVEEARKMMPGMEELAGNETQEEIE